MSCKPLEHHYHDHNSEISPDSPTDIFESWPQLQELVSLQEENVFAALWLFLSYGNTRICFFFFSSQNTGMLWHFVFVYNLTICIMKRHCNPDIIHLLKQVCVLFP